MRQTKTKTRENEAMRAARDEMVPVTLPGPGLQLTVRRQFTAGSVVYPAGSIISDIRVLGPGYSALMSGHYLEWRPGNSKPVAKARALPPPTPEKPRPAVEIIADPDPVASWHRSLESMTEKCDGNAARAKDMLLAHREGSALYLRAQKVWCDGEAKRRGVVSVSPAI
jgi:hypothetical protein